MIVLCTLSVRILLKILLHLGTIRRLVKKETPGDYPECIGINVYFLSLIKFTEVPNAHCLPYGLGRM